MIGTMTHKTVGAIAADIFDKIIIKEDLNLRIAVQGSRKTLKKGFIKGNEKDQIEIIYLKLVPWKR